jgi:uncharacterized protein (TIGR00299 family) protein
MKVAYFDCIAGASGDMILGALVDAGLPLHVLVERLQALHLPDFNLEAQKVTKSAFSATKVNVIVADDVPERHLSDIINIVEESDLPVDIQKQAIDIFQKIGSAEASIHGTSLDHVHLHELGGVDTIVDVVGALVGLQALGIEHIVCSPIPLGRGFIRGAHGAIPLPAPATVALLKGVPIVGSPLEMETVTPTGAALLSSLADEFGPIPQMDLEQVGYGAGSRDLPIPNVLRILIGANTPSKTNRAHRNGQHPESPLTESNADHNHDHPHPHEHPHNHTHAGDASSHPPVSMIEPQQDCETPHNHITAKPAVHNKSGHSHSCLDTDHLSVLETNIDDLNPEFYEYVMDRLFAAGALDVFLAPIQMKKNRPATLLRVLCRPDNAKSMTDILFQETSTLGIREHAVDRHALPRTLHTVETLYGAVQVKVAELGDGTVKSAPEYADCRRLAEQHGVPIREIYLAAQQQAKAEFGG